MANEEKGMFRTICKTYIENAEKITWNTTKGNIKISSADDLLVSSKNGIVLGDYEPTKCKSTNNVLKKFLVNFRRPKDYNGSYGFDWLRDEYIYPFTKVGYSNNNAVINSKIPLCTNVNNLKTEYLKDVKNPILPYGKPYYPAWLSIFPHTTTAQFSHGSSMDANGIKLDIEVIEVEALINDDTFILFECSNKYINISPLKIKLSEFLKLGKKRTSLEGITSYNHYKLHERITIKCEGGTLSQHEEIKVFALLEKQKIEVGKLMLYKNNVIPKMEIVMINVITTPNSENEIQTQRVKAYEFNFKSGGFNQALIRSEVIIYNNFDINSLPNTDIDVIDFKTNFIGHSTVYSEAVRKALVKLYDKYGKYKPVSGIESNNNNRTFIFFTEMNAGGTRGITSCKEGDNSTAFEWGNAYIIFKDGLINRRAILHEAGHSMGLQHTFSSGDLSHGLKPPPHTFYQGYTDNIMDYTWQVHSNASNPYDNKDKMKSLFKWQWDIFRKDRSLIFNY